jgi:NAD(P)-dependent dehydrogenase (short-subunit alcohol dehydrogenase family)
MREGGDSGDKERERRGYPPGGAVVFGGSGGVGRAICARLAEAGCDVALTYRTNAAAAEEVAAGIRARGRKAEVHAVSAGDEQAIESLLALSAERFGGVHTVVHAAGSDIPMRFVSEISRAQWREVMEADATGFFDLVRASLPHLRAARGSIVAVTSAGLYRFPSRDVLSVAPKAAIETLVRAVAKEEGRYGVRANCVALGVIEAGIFHRLTQTPAKGEATGGEIGKDWIAAAHRNTPLRRFGTAEEAADAVEFLASPRASYITGQTILLDGGYSL